MKSPSRPVRTSGKPKPKATSRAKPPAPAGAKLATDGSASSRIDQRIRELGGWRGETLARMRALILEADPEMIEEWKWMGTPVWSHDGIVCTGEAYKLVVKHTFAHGASLPDPKRLFNSSLEGNTRRAIDIREGENLDASAFKALVKAAVAFNGARGKKPSKAPARKASAKPKATSRARTSRKPARSKSPSKADATSEPGARSAPKRRAGSDVVLLSGGNPRIAKAEGDAAVQAYLAALPGSKRDVARRLDALITRSVPGVHKAVKWNSPFYGIAGQGWFLGLHTFTHYLKVAFFRGASLRPLPPGVSKTKDTRYLDLHDGDELDEAQLSRWVKQAAALPGWAPGRSR